MSGFIVLDRKILDWQFFRSSSAVHLWITILLKANWKDGKLYEEEIPRGSFATSISSLAQLTDLSESTIRRWLKVPQCVQDAIARYKADNDWMTHFLEECCEVGDGLEEKSGELYSSYRSFCARSGEFCRSTTEFYSMLKTRGFERVRRNNGRFVLGLKLAEEEADF